MCLIKKSLLYENVHINILDSLNGELGFEIKNYKFNNSKETPKIIESAFNFLESKKKHIDLILYIPSSGNNNSFLKSRVEIISKKLNINYLDIIKLSRKISEQKYLESKKERIKNVQNAFYIENIDLIENNNVVLIDDVYATGSTLKEVINLLKTSKIKSLECLVFVSKE